MRWLLEEAKTRSIMLEATQHKAVSSINTARYKVVSSAVSVHCAQSGTQNSA